MFIGGVARCKDAYYTLVVDLFSFLLLTFSLPLGWGVPVLFGGIGGLTRVIALRLAAQLYV